MLLHAAFCPVVEVSCFEHECDCYFVAAVSSKLKMLQKGCPGALQAGSCPHTSSLNQNLLVLEAQTLQLTCACSDLVGITTRRICAVHLTFYLQSHKQLPSSILINIVASGWELFLFCTLWCCIVLIPIHITRVGTTCLMSAIYSKQMHAKCGTS